MKHISSILLLALVVTACGSADSEHSAPRAPEPVATSQAKVTTTWTRTVVQTATPSDNNLQSYILFANSAAQYPGEPAVQTYVPSNADPYGFINNDVYSRHALGSGEQTRFVEVLGTLRAAVLAALELSEYEGGLDFGVYHGNNGVLRVYSFDNGVYSIYDDRPASQLLDSTDEADLASLLGTIRASFLTSQGFTIEQ